MVQNEDRQNGNIPLKTHFGGKVASVTAEDIWIELEVCGSFIVGKQ
jgi:hypothetical protein